MEKENVENITSSINETKKDEKGSGVWAAILIISGVILLFNTLGILSWEIWGFILRFWPVTLILWGIEIIFGKSGVSRFIVTLISLAIGAFILALALAPTNPKIDNWLKKNFPGLPKNFRIYPKFEEEDFFTSFEIKPKKERFKIYQYYRQ